MIGAGTVINPSGLVEEMRALAGSGVDVDRLLISERAHLIMPYHRLVEEIERLIGVHIVLVSVGPERESAIARAA